MRIFLAGDHVTGTGPANVTQYYIDNLPEGTLYQKRQSKPARLAEIAVNTVRADVVVYSGYSKQNIWGMKLARILKKPSAYLMHGCVEHENAINLEPDDEMTRVERQTLELADLIIAVSPVFSDWLKDNYPMHAHKIDHVTNGIDTGLKHDRDPAGTDRHMIFSVGGGMPRKKIRYICEAVSKLRREYDPEMYVCVTGAEGADTPAVDAYDFIDNRGKVSFAEEMELFSKAALFVQNSCFETFGLAPVEALMTGCSVVCSRAVGAMSLTDGLRDEDVIERYDDPDEIAAKIKYTLENPNAERLLAGIDVKRFSWKERGLALTSKLSELLSGKQQRK